VKQHAWFLMKALIFALCLVFAMAVSRRSVCVATVAGTHAIAYMAGRCAWSPACRGAGDRYADWGKLAGHRTAGDWGEQLLTAYDDRLFAEWKEHRRCGRRLPWCGYRGLAIDLEGTEVCDWLTPRGITWVLLRAIHAMTCRMGVPPTSL